MTVAPFVGRDYELSLLNDLLQKTTASLVVINGRRRIGKSRLIEKFAHDKPFYQFSGLAPNVGITAQSQRDEFTIQLSKQTDMPVVKLQDWSEVFQLLADKVKTGRKIILFDEITWMGYEDPTFLSKLKNAWDMYYKKNPKLILILCGSVSAWIEENILSSSGYFGRVSLHITLQKLPIHHSLELLDKLGFQRSQHEKLLYLSLTGGVPWYIEQIKPKYSAIENIKRLCFEKDSLLLNEYQYIFNDLFGKRSAIYQKIVEALVNGSLEYDDISKKIHYSKGSVLTSYLKELVVSGYLSEYCHWNLDVVEATTICKYRICDNFLRFYFKFMAKKKRAIEKGQFLDADITAIPAWWSNIGLQLESLVLENRNVILNKLSIKGLDIVMDDPYFQRNTKRIKGCQIDYLIQTRFKTIFACEIRYSKNPLPKSIVKEVSEKIKRLNYSKNQAILPVLIHFNEVLDEVYESEFFYQIINFSELI